jgi:N-acetylmuramoyl-L-alanine amidase
MEKLSRVEYLVIHHSATKDGKVFDWNAIRNYHINVNKWKDIGYHFGIENINDSIEILIGRLPMYIGAHIYGLNSISLGVCIIGNYDEEILPDEKYQKLLGLLEYLIPLYNIKLDKIIGHRDVKVLYDLGIISYEVYQQNIKTCPGLNFSMKKVRQDISKILNIPESNTILYQKLNEYDDYVIKNKKI